MSSVDLLKKRLKETFGTDSQETVGKKLDMTQGNVSKLLSGSQQPTLDTLYRIAEIYGVSIDWLMGLSSRKNIVKDNDEISYGLAIEVVSELLHHGALLKENPQKSLSVEIKDPILEKLIKKGNALSKTDWDLYKDWKNKKLSLFDDKSLLWPVAFHAQGMEFLVAEASTEAHLLEVYKEARKEQDKCEKMMADNYGPFGG